jgi:hypothetical protein
VVVVVVAVVGVAVVDAATAFHPSCRRNRPALRQLRVPPRLPAATACSSQESERTLAGGVRVLGERRKRFAECGFRPPAH